MLCQDPLDGGGIDDPFVVAAGGVAQGNGDVVHIDQILLVEVWPRIPELDDVRSGLGLNRRADLGLQIRPLHVVDIDFDTVLLAPFGQDARRSAPVRRERNRTRRGC